MSTRSGRVRPSIAETSPPRTRKGVSPPRSPGRARKSSPPARSARKSPSRKSPSRKPASKSPARKSPSRSVKETKEISESTPPKSPVKRPTIKTDSQVRLEDISAKLEIFRGTRSRRTEYSIKDLTTGISSTDFVDEKVNGLESILNPLNDYGLRNRRSVEDFGPPRRSSRLRDITENIPDIRRSYSKSLTKSISESVSKSIDTFSDEDHSDDIQREKSKSVTRKLATPLRESISKLRQATNKFEFGGQLGTGLLLTIIPAVVFLILISCSNQCRNRTILNPSAFKSLTWFSSQTLLLLLAQYVIQATFSLIPILGTKVSQANGRKYCFNAFVSSIFTVNVLFTLDHFKIWHVDNILESYLNLAATSYALAVVISIILYIKSRRLDRSQLNPYGCTQNIVYDFFMGREIEPWIKKLNVKLWLSRICNINALILSVLIFKHSFVIQEKDIENLSWNNYREFMTKVHYKPTLLLYSMMQLIYVLHFIMQEHKILFTFYWQSEGLGYLQTVSSALYPFYFTTIAKFVADAEISLSTNTLAIASALYAVGFLLMLISNNVKFEFRKNPLQPGLARMESMPTFHGNKLLVANLWGVLRHPNYTGDIMIHIALALPGILSQRVFAAAPALLTILILLHRAWRDHARCKERYGSAWQRYCKRVPSVVLPKIL